MEISKANFTFSKILHFAKSNFGFFKFLVLNYTLKQISCHLKQTTFQIEYKVNLQSK